MKNSWRNFSPLAWGVLLTSLAFLDCGDRARCDQLRQDTLSELAAWAQCTSDQDCVALPGNVNDCTGVLSCPFAVNAEHRGEAEIRMLNIGEDSVECHVCATLNCGVSAATSCDAASHQCTIVQTTFSPAGRPVDSGVGDSAIGDSRTDVETDSP